MVERLFWRDFAELEESLIVTAMMIPMPAKITKNSASSHAAVFELRFGGATLWGRLGEDGGWLR